MRTCVYALINVVCSCMLPVLAGGRREHSSYWAVGISLSVGIKKFMCLHGINELLDELSCQNKICQGMLHTVHHKLHFSSFVILCFDLHMISRS